MDFRLLIWTLVLSFSIIYWMWQNYAIVIDYDRNPELINPSSGSKIAPSELLTNFSKVIQAKPEYISATSAQERLYHLEHNINIANVFISDYVYTNHQDLIQSGWPIANQSLCDTHLKWILDQLEKYSNYTLITGEIGRDLTSLMDSFGKQPSSVYSGVVNWLGSYEQCAATSLDSGRIKTRYCILRTQFKHWPHDERMHQKTTIRIGVCLPETCDTLSFGLYNSSIGQLAKLELADLYKSQLDLHSMYCPPDHRSPISKLPLSGRIYLVLVGGWFLLVVIASIIYERSKSRENQNLPSTIQIDEPPKQAAISYNLLIKQPRKENSPSNKILEALSLRCIIKEFKSNRFQVDFKHGGRVRVNLGCLDFLKVLMIVLIILGHSGYLADLHSQSLQNRVTIRLSKLGRLGISLPNCVQTFFLFFGILTTYTMMRKFSIKQLESPLTWVLVNLLVLLRLLPLLMLIYWYSKSVAPYVGSGPWWDHGTDERSLRGSCVRSPWYTSIPYFGNGRNLPVPACNPPTWFIVCYAQISLILPLLTYILCKLPNYALRCLLICLIVIISSLSIAARMARQTTLGSETFSVYGVFILELLEKFELSGYNSALGRLGSVVTGCFVGYLLRQYEVGIIKNWLGWTHGKVAMLMIVLSHTFIVLTPFLENLVFRQTGSSISLTEFVLGAVITSIAWPILNSLLVINLTTVYNHTLVVRFLSHSIWHILNRLTYCMFLIHWEVLINLMTNFGLSPGLGLVSNGVELWAACLSLCVLISLVLHIFVEAPLSRLVMASSSLLMPK